MNTIDTEPIGPLDEADDEILAGMARLYAALDPVPAGLTDDVKFAMTVQALHAEVADLTRLGAPELAVRSVDYARTETVSFTTDHLSATVTLTALTARRSRIDGWLTGVPVRRVELRGGGVVQVVEPADGGFVFPDVARGLVQLVFFPVEESLAPVITPHLEV